MSSMPLPPGSPGGSPPSFLGASFPPSFPGAAPPPPGVVPNLKHPVSRASSVITINVIFLGFALAFVLMRVYTRTFLTRNIGADDYVCLLAMINSVVFSAIELTKIKYGFGIHLWEVPLDKFSPGFLYYMAANVAVLSSLMFIIKLTAGLLYLRLFGSNGKLKIAVWSVLFFSFGYSVSGIAISIWRCSPRSKAWEVKMVGGACHDHSWRLVMFGAFDVFADFIMLIVPLPILWKLQLPKRQKIILTAVFMTGAFVCVVGAVRLQVFTKVFHTTDVTWTLTNSSNWDVVEANVGIACVCMPCLKPLIDRYAPSFLKISSLRSRKSSGGSSGIVGSRMTGGKTSDQSRHTGNTTVITAKTTTTTATDNRDDDGDDEHGSTRNNITEMKSYVNHHHYSRHPNDNGDDRC